MCVKCIGCLAPIAHSVVADDLGFMGGILRRGLVMRVNAEVRGQPSAGGVCGV